MGIHALHIQHVMLLSVYLILTIANSVLYKGMRGIHWFTAYNVLALAGAISVAFRGFVPSSLSIVIGNVCVIAAYAALFTSIADLFGRRSRQVYLHAAFVLGGLIAMVAYGQVHPDTRLRLIAYSLILGCQQFQIAILIARKQDGSLRRIGGPMALTLSALATVNSVRLVYVVVRGAPGNYLDAGPFLSSVVTINTCLQCGLMVAYVWMTSALLRRDLEEQASTDPLTGLLNRRALELRAEREIDACHAANCPLSALFIDLDSFKPINDSYGHKLGDRTLIAVGESLQQGLRSTDLLARIGGDEFAVLLPNTNLAEAEALAERLRNSLQQLTIELEQKIIRISASFGVGQARLPASWDLLATRCDHALYAAKRAGGNVIRSDVAPARPILEPLAIPVVYQAKSVSTI